MAMTAGRFAAARDGSRLTPVKTGLQRGERIARQKQENRMAKSARIAVRLGLLVILYGATGHASGQGLLFDFESATLHAPLPIDVNNDGISAHLSATAQEFSVQDPSSIIYFTPAGFSPSQAICPSSINAADLMVSFNTILSDFSILFAPQELACDDTATMRVTGYLGTTFVATATAQAPSPGTWPTGTLTLNAPQGFDNVVVHYDARPPTCGDWGPIFMADNMTVLDRIFAGLFE
jgi:hypothetical protein